MNDEYFYLDEEFLKELFHYHHRVTYARITSLTIDEDPKVSIEGRVSQGSVNLDGNSSLRRTCSLTMITEQPEEVNEYDWTLSTKFKLEIGLENKINSLYPEIVWFKLGVYVITSFNSSVSLNGRTVSIQGKDKMCLINGDVSGAIYASVDFGTYEYEDKNTGEKIKEDYEIENIIREAVHEYGHEPWHNIVIKDLPKYGLNMLQWQGNVPLYVLVNGDGSDENSQAITSGTFNTVEYSESTDRTVDPTKTYYIKISEEGEEPVRYATVTNPQGDPQVLGQYERVTTSDSIDISNLQNYLTVNYLTYTDKADFDMIGVGDKQYYVCKINPGQSAGFEVTTLTQPRGSEESGLVTNIGDSVTSVLDKIVTFLGDYEYFYNEDGQFVFQKKNKYLDRNWNNNDFDATSMGNEYTLISYLPTSWDFSGNELVVSTNRAPNLNNIKNDFSIWGKRTSKNGDSNSDIPIHLRYGINIKPFYYKSISMTGEEISTYVKINPELEECFKYTIQEGNKVYEDVQSYTYISYDYPNPPDPLPESWRQEDYRELIYQMALDYRKFNHLDEFQSKIMNNNFLDINNEIKCLYPNGITGYEQYYVDIEGFWRYLYRPDYDSNEYGGKLITAQEDLDLGTQENPKHVYVNDHFYTYSELIADGYTEDSEGVEGYYIAKIEGNPYLVGNFKKIDYENWMTSHEYRISAASDYENFVAKWNNSGTPISLVRANINGTSNGLYYNSEVLDVPLKWDNTEWNESEYHSYTGGTGIGNRNVLRTTSHFYLLIPIDRTHTLQELQGVTISSSNFGVTTNKYNYHTIYEVLDENNKKQYYMFQDHSTLKRINTPSLEPLTWFGTQENVWLTSIENSQANNPTTQNSYIISKCMCWDKLPRTAAYFDKIVTSKEVFLSYSGTTDIYRLYGHENCQRWKLVTPYYREGDEQRPPFPGETGYKTSTLYLNKNKTGYIEKAQWVQTNGKNLFLGLEDGSQVSEFNKYYRHLDYDAFGHLIDNSLKSYPIAYYQDTVYYYTSENQADNKWNVLKNESPELLNFWFEILESEQSKIGKYGANVIQNRSKAASDDEAKAIYYRETLNIVYYQISRSSDEEYNKLINYAKDGYNIFYISDLLYSCFRISNAGKSCKDVLDQWLYGFTQANETSNLTTIPIYILQPNNRISTENGEYVINSLSIPLAYNGTMNINATKMVSSIY